MFIKYSSTSLFQCAKNVSKKKVNNGTRDTTKIFHAFSRTTTNQSNMRPPIYSHCLKGGKSLLRIKMVPQSMNCIVSLALKGLHAGSRLHKVEVLKYVIVVRHYCTTVVPPPLEKRRTEKQITMQTCVHYLFTTLFKNIFHIWCSYPLPI